MSKKTWSLVSAAVVLGLLLWAFKPAPLTPSNKYGKATFTRPTKIAASAKDIAISIDGVDAIAEIPSVPTNHKVSIGVVLPLGVDRELEMIIVVPRLPSQDPDGFEWIDARCDSILPLNSPVPTTLGDGRQFYTNTTFCLRPGEYMVRYYRQIMNFDPEKGPSRNEFVGQSRLVVTESKSTEPTYVPLEDKKSIGRAYRPDDED